MRIQRTRGWGSQGGGVARLDGRAVSISDGRHVEHDRVEAVGSKASWAAMVVRRR